MRVICLTFVSLQSHNFWFYAYFRIYIGALSLWIGHLWSYQPSPQPKNNRADLDDEYKRMRPKRSDGFKRCVVIYEDGALMIDFLSLIAGVLLV